MFFFSNQGSSGESAKLSSQLEYSVYVLHHGKVFFHVLGQLTISELPFLSLFQNESSFKTFHMKMRFDTEANGNSEMAYLLLIF